MTNKTIILLSYKCPTPTPTHTYTVIYTSYIPHTCTIHQPCSPWKSLKNRLNSSAITRLIPL